MSGHYRFRRSFGNVGSLFRGARPDTYPRFTGLLDTYGGAAAAYSLRALSSGWLAGDVVEVRRSSDSTSDSFTASQITSGAMLDFVNGGTTSLYNDARYFNGTSTSVLLDSNVTMSGDFDVTISGVPNPSGSFPQVVAVAVGSPHRIRLSTSTVIRIQISGTNYEFTVTDSTAWSSLRVTRIGTTLELFLDDASQGTKTAITDGFILGQFGTGGGAYFDGVLYSIDLNGQAAYTGLGTSVTAWEDTIGSNDGTEANGAAYTGQPFDGFVSTWYDQSGNANDATQATTTAQPKIVDAGALVVGGLDFDGVDDSMQSAAFTSTPQPITRIAVTNFSNVGATRYVIDGSSANRGAVGTTSAPAWRIFSGTVANYATGPSVSTDYLLFCKNSGASSELSVNGVGLGLKDAGTAALDQVTIGVNPSDDNNGLMLGTINEIIIYNSDQSANQAAIEANINAAYSIY